MSTEESISQKNERISLMESPVLSPESRGKKVLYSMTCINEIHHQSPAGSWVSSVRHRSRNNGAATFHMHQHQHSSPNHPMPPMLCSPPGSDNSAESDLLFRSVDEDILVPMPPSNNSATPTTSRRCSTPRSTRSRKSWKDSDEVALAAQLSLPQLYNDDDFSSSSWSSSAAITISTNAASTLAAAVCDTRSSTICSPGQLSLAYHAMKRVVAVLVLVSLSYQCGIQTERYKNRKLVEGQRTRDELLINQERLLINLVTKAATTTSSSSALASSNSIEDSSLTINSSNSGHNQYQNSEILQHLDLLQKELNDKSQTLEKEIQLRREAEAEAKEAWGSYQLFTAQLKGASKEEHQDLAKLARTLLIQYFGRGPHFVQFELTIHPNRIGQQQKSAEQQDAAFTVEMSSIDYIPLSVFFFLKQVEAGLWDDTSFRLNDPYTITAQPKAGHGLNSRLSGMASMGLAYLPFLEHNDKVPHHAYTLGFSGKDHRGPDFFVNKVDNSKNRIVAGQPCFGTVIIGRETIDMIGQIQGPAADPFFIDPVDIVSVSIVKDIKDVRGGPEYLLALSQKGREEI